MTSYKSQQSESDPNPEFIAQQLRKPSGNFAPKVGKKMNLVNKPLYDLTYDVMELNNNDHILEIGFGTGKFFGKLFDKNDTIQVSGLDYSEEMVKAARETNEEIISEGNLNIKVGSSKSIPFPDQTFDKVFCNMVIYFWDDPKKHLQEINRVFKAGGLFYTGLRARKSMLAFPFTKYGFNLYSTEEWKEILVQNDFRIQATHKRLDPPLDLDGNQLRLESCCIVAEK